MVSRILPLPFWLATFDSFSKAMCVPLACCLLSLLLLLIRLAKNRVRPYPMAETDLALESYVLTARISALLSPCAAPCAGGATYWFSLGSSIASKIKSAPIFSQKGSIGGQNHQN